MRKDENGYIVVETIGAFILFVLLITSILSLVNIVALQARVHYAITQAAQTLSMYSYTLEVTGVADHLSKLSNKANKDRENANEFINNINGLLTGIESLSIDDTKHYAGEVYNGVESALDNPKETISSLARLTLEETRNFVFGEIAQALVGRYLRNGSMNGDEYLKSVNVIDGLDGLQFYGFLQGNENSSLIDENGDIKLIVRYEVEYRFGALPLPFKPKLAVTQIVKTKAWLNGSGKGYW